MPSHQIPTSSLAEAIEEIELGRLQDDAYLVRRMQRLQRADSTNTFIFSALLVASFLLLLVGLASQSAVPWIASGAAFLAALGVHGRYTWRFPRES